MKRMIGINATRTTRFLTGVAMFAGALLAFPSCQQLTPMGGRTVDVITTGDLEAVGPIDIAVAPVVDLTEGVQGGEIPDRILRTAFQRALLKRRYSPLSIGYVDSFVVDGAYAHGSAAEDAVLVLSIERWNDTLWEIHHALEITMEVRVVDPTAPAGSDLWKGRVERRFDKSDFPGHDGLSTDVQRFENACNSIASEILAAMPARTSAPGRL